MSKEATLRGSAGEPADDISAVEANLGKVLVLIHRALPWLDESERGADVQTALRQAAACLERARVAHDQSMPVQTAVDSETVAIIAASIAAVFDSPYRLVSVQPTPAALSASNAWALEGRTQIFQSHRFR